MLTLRPDKIFVYTRKNLILGTLFILLYVLSGVLFLSPLPYRMGPMSILYGLILLVFFRIKITPVTFVIFALCLVSILSGFINGSSTFQIVYFLRIPLFAYFTYYVVSICGTKQNLASLIYWGRVVAVIQMPVILFQEISYPLWPTSLQKIVSLLDAGFGTFNFKTDYSISIFLLLHLILILFFDRQLSQPKRVFFIVWLSLSILIANAEFIKVIFALVIALYFFLKFATWRIMLPILGSVVLIAILVGVVDIFNSNFYSKETANPIATSARRIQGVLETVRDGDISYERYLEGEYDRVAAIRYVFWDYPTLIGEGPAEFDPVYGDSSRGNTGHTLEFAAEVGLVGALLSLVFYLVVARVGIWHRLPKNARLTLQIGFAILVISSFVYPIMNDIAVVFSYTTFAFYILSQTEFLQTEDQAVHESVGPALNV